MRPGTTQHETVSQTAGPYVHIGLLPNACGLSGVYDADPGSEMVNDLTRGERISIRGAVFDGTGTPVQDALVEIWQADSEGRLGTGDPRGPGDQNFCGWGRSGCDENTGDWHFDTIRPGRVPAKGSVLQAPHITLWIVARGLNVGLHTRIYFPDEAEANAEDPVLARIEHKNRIPTLIATREDEGLYRFNIHLQGPEETVFFDV